MAAPAPCLRLPDLFGGSALAPHADQPWAPPA